MVSRSAGLRRGKIAQVRICRRCPSAGAPRSGFALLLVLALFGCSPRPAPNSQTVAGPGSVYESRASDLDSSPTPSARQRVLFTPTARVTLSPGPESITSAAQLRISASGGNLFIRRGPHLAFNPISVLFDGKSANAIGRDVLARWLQVVLPEDAGSTGWISIQTRYSVLEGSARQLPVVPPHECPLAAYLINCTAHEMLIRPGDVVVPSVLDFPANEVVFFPGVYTIHDLGVDDLPEVQSAFLSEGSQVEIRMDGLGGRRHCP